MKLLNELEQRCNELYRAMQSALHSERYKELNRAYVKAYETYKRQLTIVKG